MAKKRTTGVYIIKSKIKPSCFYIGSSVNIEHRKIQHKFDLVHNRGRSPKLQNHVNKYGFDDLSFFIIETFDFVSTEHLDMREQYYLDLLKPSLNTSLRADHVRLGMKHSAETIEKIKQAQKGKIMGGMKGKHHSKETKKKLSESHKGQKSWNKGKKLTDEHKRKLSIAKRGKQSPMKGISLSDEQKEKVSHSVKKLWENPEYREKNRKGRRRWHHTEESKLKISEGNLKRWQKIKQDNG